MLLNPGMRTNLFLVNTSDIQISDTYEKNILIIFSC